MSCQKCKIHSVHEFTNKVKLCRECFIDYFERKIFRTIRKYQMGMLNIAGDKKDARYKIIKIISGKIKIGRSPKAERWHRALLQGLSKALMHDHFRKRKQSLLHEVGKRLREVAWNRDELCDTIIAKENYISKRHRLQSKLSWVGWGTLNNYCYSCLYCQ